MKNTCLRTDESVRVKRGWQLRQSDMKNPTGTSQTIKDDSYTVRELLIKHTRGINLGLERSTFYPEDADFDDEDFSKVRNYDLHEKEILMESAKEVIRRKTKKPEPEPKPEPKEEVKKEEDVPPSNPS